MDAISWLGSPTCLTVVMLAATWFLMRAGHWRETRRVWAFYGVSFVLVILLKNLFRRARPDELVPHIGYAFPSGHALLSVVVYGWLALRCPAPWRTTVTGAVAVLCVLIGISRVYLQTHFLTDVLAGYALGGFMLWGYTHLGQVPDGRSHAHPA